MFPYESGYTGNLEFTAVQNIIPEDLFIPCLNRNSKFKNSRRQSRLSHIHNSSENFKCQKYLESGF